MREAAIEREVSSTNRTATSVRVRAVGLVRQRGLGGREPEQRDRRDGRATRATAPRDGGRRPSARAPPRTRTRPAAAAASGISAASAASAPSGVRNVISTRCPGAPPDAPCRPGPAEAVVASPNADVVPWPRSGAAAARGRTSPPRWRGRRSTASVKSAIAASSASPAARADAANARMPSSVRACEARLWIGRLAAPARARSRLRPLRFDAERVVEQLLLDGAPLVVALSAARAATSPPVPSIGPGEAAEAGLRRPLVRSTGSSA